MTNFAPSILDIFEFVSSEFNDPQPIFQTSSQDLMRAIDLCINFYTLEPMKVPCSIFHLTPNGVYLDFETSKGDFDIGYQRGWNISRLFVYFDDHREASLSGQFNNLKEIKNDFFAKLKYLQCGNGKSISQKLERRRPPPKNDMVNAIEEQVSLSINLIRYLILSVCFIYPAMYMSQKRKMMRLHLKSV